MSNSDGNEETVVTHMGEGGIGMENTPESIQNDSIVHDLWNLEDDLDACQKEEVNTPDNLKFELETLAIEKERLKKENRKLAEMLESIKIEEDIALLRQEVSILGEEKEQLLAEIQRRKQSMHKNV